MRSIYSYLIEAARECKHARKVPLEGGDGTLCLGCAAGALKALLEQKPEEAEEAEAVRGELAKVEGFPRLVLMLGDEKLPKPAKAEIGRALRLLGVLRMPVVFLFLSITAGCGLLDTMRADRIHYPRPDCLPEVTGKRIHIPPKSRERMYLPADYRDEGPVVDLRR